MNPKQDYTDEEIRAILDEICGPLPRKKPKVVVNEAEVVRDADVRVGPADPNYSKSNEGVVQVRRKDWVTVNVGMWEEQQRQKKEDQRLRRALDPYRLGHWGSDDVSIW